MHHENVANVQKGVKVKQFEIKWQLMMKLKDIANIRAGHPFRGKVIENKDAPTKVIQIRDISRDGKINWETVISANVENKRGNVGWLQKGDVIFTARGPKNIAACLAHELEEPIVCSPHFFIIQVTKPDELLPEFLAWQLNQAPAQRYFDGMAEGSWQVGINKSSILELKLAVPDIDTQYKIIELAKTALKEKRIMLELIRNRESQLQGIARKI